MNKLLPLVFAIGTQGGCAQAESRESVAPQLTLRASVSHTLAEPAIVVGISGTAADSLLMWGGAGSRLRMLRGQSLTELKASLPPIAGAILRSKIHIVDVITENGWRYRLDIEGQLLDSVFLTKGETIIAAAASDSLWFIVSSDGTLVRASVYDGATSSRRRSRVLPHARWHAYVYGEQVVLTRVSYPFNVLIMDPSLSSLAGPRREELPDEMFRYWISLPAVPLNNRYVQVIANPKTNERLIVTFDSSGKIIGEKRMVAPFGIIYGVGDAKLIGVRRLNKVELVVFQASVQ